jgi:hypothetical protein
MGTRITRFYDSTTITNPIAAKRFASRLSRDSFIVVENTSIFIRSLLGLVRFSTAIVAEEHLFELSENETGGVTRR